jgi:hypothetical protein
MHLAAENLLQSVPLARLRSDEPMSGVLCRDACVWPHHVEAASPIGDGPLLANAACVADVARVAIQVALAPLAYLAFVARGSPAVDICFLPVLPVVRALAGDTLVGDSVARDRGAIGVLLTWVPIGAWRADPAERGRACVTWHLLAPHTARWPARDPCCPDGAAPISVDARPNALNRRLARNGEAGVVVGTNLGEQTAFLIVERALVVARQRFLGGVDRGRVSGRTTADVGAESTVEANISGQAVSIVLAPLAAPAAVASTPAVDVRFRAVLPVIRALIADTFVTDGVAGVGSAIGVLLTRVADGAEGAGPRLTRDAARDVRPARDRLCPNGAPLVSDDARPNAFSLRLARNRMSGVVVGANLRQQTTFLITELALVVARRVFAGLARGVACGRVGDPVARITGVVRGRVGGRVARVTGVVRGRVGGRVARVTGVVRPFGSLDDVR